MNKSFEIEYKKYADSNIPDLWDRIEAGVDKLEAANKEENETNEISKDNIADINEKKANKKNKIINFMATHGVQVMAAVVSVFVIPGIVILAVRNSGNMDAPAAQAAYSEAPAAEEAAADYCMEEPAAADDAEADYCMEEPVAEEAEVDYCMEEPVAEEAEADYCMEETAEVAAAEAADESAGTEDANKYFNGIEKKGIQNFASKDSDMDDYAAAEANRLDNITAVINSRNEDGTYQITVVNDPNGRFKADEELTVTIQTKAEEAYKALPDKVKTGNLVVSILADEEAENMYTIVDVSKKK